MAILPCQFTRKGELNVTFQIGNEGVELLVVFIRERGFKLRVRQRRGIDELLACCPPAAEPPRKQTCNWTLEAQWPIGYGVGLRIKRSSVRIRPWPLRWVLGQGSLLPLSQGEAFTLASISYLAILVKYILAKKKKKKKNCQTLVFWHNCVRVALSFRQTVHVTKKSPCSQHSSCLCIFLRGWHIDRREKGSGKSRSQPLQNRNARARAQTKREVRQKKGNWNLSISKERKKETERQGKAGEQSGKCQETANGPPTRHSVASRSQTRPHISMVILESVWFWCHGVLWRHFSPSLCTRFLLLLFLALWTEFFSSAKGWKALRLDLLGVRSEV